MFHVQPTLALGLVSGALVPTFLAAQGIKLNGPLPVGITGDVTNFEVSADSSRVVYCADQDAEGVVGLYSVPIGGGEAVTLAATLARTGGDPSFQHAFRITPDARTVVYRVDLGSDLFSVPIVGGQPGVLLNGPFDSDYVASFEISPDSRRVVYLAATDWWEDPELFSVPTHGGIPVKLNGPLVEGGRVRAYRLSDDGQQVVYLTDQGVGQVCELFVVPIGGGVPVELSAMLGADDSVQDDFQIAPGSKDVVYRAENRLSYTAKLFAVSLLDGPSRELSGASVEFFQITPDPRRVVFVRDGALHVVRLSGGRSIPLSDPLDAPEHVDEFVLASGSAWVVYHVEHGRGEGSSEVALYSVPITGGAVTELARPPDLFVGSPLVSSDSSRVVFTVFDYSGVTETWSAPIAGGPPVRLSSDESFFAELDPDSSRLVYVAGHYDPLFNITTLELFSIPVAGGKPTRLNGPLVDEGGVVPYPSPGRPRISPDGARVIYLADQERDEVLELFSVPIGGGAATRLNPDLVTGGTAGDVERTVVSTDGTHAVYRADQETDEVFELYSVRLAGRGSPPGLPIKVSGPLVRNGDVATVEVTPDSQRAVYVADQEVAGVRELYSVPIDGGEPVKLSEERGLFGIHGFLVSPDSERVVYLNDVHEAFQPALFSAPIDGGPSVDLSAAIPGLDFVSGHVLSSDSSRVVFAALRDDEALLELYSIPIAGGTLTTLNAVPVAGGRVDTFQILPDASAVVYAGDLEEDDVTELFIVPIDGGPSVELSEVGGLRDVSRFSISADSGHVVYLADQERNNVFELYGVTLSDGTRVELNPTPVTDGDVISFVIAPDSGRVVYLADQDTNDVFELYSVPIAGGPAMRLDGPLLPGEAFQVSPASDRVVYRAGLELYSVAITGGQSTKLNGMLGIGERVERDFAISADSRHVVFRAGRIAFDSDGTFELFAAPIEGGRPPARLSGAPVELGGVTPPSESFRSFQLAGNRVVYRADQDEYATFELFQSFLPLDARATTRDRTW